MCWQFILKAENPLYRMMEVNVGPGEDCIQKVHLDKELQLWAVYAHLPPYLVGQCHVETILCTLR